MIFFTAWKARRKRKQEAAQQKRAKDRTDSLALTRKALEAAGKIATPLERIQQLKKVEQDIEDKISGTTDKINNEIVKKSGWAFARTFLSSAAIAAGALVGGSALGVMAPVVGIVMLTLLVGGVFGALIGAPVAHTKVTNSTHKQLTQESQGFFGELNKMKKAAADLAATTVHEHYAEVAKSSAILALPGVRDAFTAAAVARAANDDPQPAAATPRTVAADSTPTI